MGPLSALEQFLCNGLALRTQTHAHATRVCARSSFHASIPMPRGRGGRSGVRERADNSELRTRQSHLPAEVLDLINGSRLHCALNRAQIKKSWWSLRWTGEEGSCLVSLLKPMEANDMIPHRICHHSTTYELSPCFHVSRLSEAALACQSHFYLHHLFSISSLFVAIVPSFPNSIIISIIISVTHPDFHSYHIYIKSVMHLHCWIIQATTWTRRGWFIFKTDTYP